MPLIGMTTLRKDAPRNASFYVRMDFYDKAVIRAGGLPVSIPSFAEEELLDAYLENLHGVLFIGGPDIPPHFYTEDPPSPTLHTLEDPVAESHLLLVKRCMAKKIPFFGICLGMQESSVANGGKMIQHLEEKTPVHSAEGIDTYHNVTLKKGSRLEKIFAQEVIRVNSSHHQSLDQDHIPANAQITAFSEDGVPESLEFSGELFQLGVQWHPERIDDEAHRMKLFSAFIDACRKE